MLESCPLGPTHDRTCLLKLVRGPVSADMFGRVYGALGVCHSLFILYLRVYHISLDHLKIKVPPLENSLHAAAFSLDLIPIPKPHTHNLTFLWILVRRGNGRELVLHTHGRTFSANIHQTTRFFSSLPPPFGQLLLLLSDV